MDIDHLESTSKWNSSIRYCSRVYNLIGGIHMVNTSDRCSIEKEARITNHHLSILLLHLHNHNSEVRLLLFLETTLLETKILIFLEIEVPQIKHTYQ